MATSDYYLHTTFPTTSSALSSSAMRSELDSITSGISAKLPDLTGNGGEILAVNSGATALEAITTTGTGSGVRATSPTLTTPVLGVATATSINGLTITTSTGTLTITNGKTLSVSNTLTFTGTDASSVAFGTGGTVTYTSNDLSVFAATTSAQLAGVISNETGTGLAVFNDTPTLIAPLLGTPTSGVLTNCTGYPASAISGLGTGVATFLATPSSANLATAVTGETGTGALVFADTPTLATPVLGVATATSINGLTITTSTGTLTITNGKTLTNTNSITLTGTDAQTYTFPATSATIARTDAAQTFTGNQSITGTLSSTGKLSTSAGDVEIINSGSDTPYLLVGKNAGANGYGVLYHDHASGELRIGPQARAFTNGGLNIAIDGTISMGLSSAANVCIGVATPGATAAKNICLSNAATAPTTSVDRAHLYCADVSAGNAALALYQEAAVSAAVATASTNKIPMIVNGTTYYVLATTVA